MMVRTRKLSIEEAKEIREKWIKSILADGFVATNNYAMRLTLDYGGDVGFAFRQKVRQIQQVERRKLSFEEVSAIYEDFEKEIKY